MSLRWVSRAFAKITRSPVRIGLTNAEYRALAERIEQRGYVLSLEAQAYIDHKFAALRAIPDETGRHIEERALLATQEAKAYADGAVESLGTGLRGLGNVVLRLSGRVEALDKAQSGEPGLSERLTQIERGLAALRDKRLVGRADELVADVAALSRQLEEEDDDRCGRHQIQRIEGALRALASDLVVVEELWRDQADGSGNAAGHDPI